MSKTLDLNNHSVIYWYFRTLWTDALNLYEPLPTTLGQYLKKYEKEDPEEYASRLKSLAQINVCYLIIESTLSMLFSTNVEITSDQYQEQVKQFVDRCTQQGDSLMDFLREQVGPMSLTYGCSDVVVDLPLQSDDVLSVQRQKALGISPYAYVIPPINRPYWRVDANGNFVEYRSEDLLNTQVQGNLNLSGTTESDKEYTSWTLEEVTRYDKGGKEIDTKANPYGFIPIVTCTPVAKSLRYPNERLGRSLIQDVIPLQKLILNVMSLIYDFHENVNFPERIWKQDTSSGDEAPTEGELSEGGNKRGKIMKGKDSDYFLVNADVRGVDSMVNYLATLIEKAFQQVMMSSDSNVNKTHQTQATIRSNQAVLFNKLTTYTKNFSKTAKEMVEMALRVQGIDPYEANIKVRWDTNFSYESFVSALEQLTILKQSVADMSPSAVAEYTKKALAPQFYGNGSGVMASVEKELDEWAKLQLDGGDEMNGSKPLTFREMNTQVNAAEKIDDGEEGID